MAAACESVALLYGGCGVGREEAAWSGGEGEGGVREGEGDAAGHKPHS